MNRINLAIEQMYSDNPNMIAEQYTYLTERQMYGDLLLTREEAQYIAEHPVLRVATYADRKPACWYDEGQGRFLGIAIEVMDRLSELTGIQFEYVPIETEGYSANELLRDDIDLVMPSVDAEYYKGNVAMQTTEPLYSLSVSLAYCKNKQLSEDGNFTVALTSRNEGIKSVLESYYPNMEFVQYDTVQDCIDALRKGRVDAYGNAIYELEYCLKNPRNVDLSVAYSFSCPIDYCLAAKSDAPNELMSILHSGISLLNEGEVAQILRVGSTFAQYDPTFSEKLYANRHILSGAGAVILFILVFWIGYVHVQKQAISAIRLKEEESRLAAEEAKRANAAKSDFLAQMSHDMRTPMNGILGLAALARDKSDISSIRSDIDQIRDEGRYLLSLINDTLDMSMIENGQLTLDLKPVESGHIIEETLRLVEGNAKAHNVTFCVEQSEVENGPVLMDKLRIQQIIINIISNAVKFSREGGIVEIHDECYEILPDKVREKFVIIDHGAGISPEFLPKVFEPFEREKSISDSVGFEGSGLGLTITKRLIDMMGGRITVESKKDVGTTVTVYLDFIRCPKADAKADEKESQKASLAGLRALLCEDNEINTIVAKGYLNKAGCAVDCAANGQVGLDMRSASEQGYYDVVLMDIHMPVMDGIEATKAIRTLPRADVKDMPIIAVTANAFEDDIKTYLASGMNAIVTKPLVMQTLSDTILNFIKPINCN